MQTPLMRAITPEPINTDVAYADAGLDHGNQKFISQEEKNAFITAPKTPVKPKKPLVCPGAPERKNLTF